MTEEKQATEAAVVAELAKLALEPHAGKPGEILLLPGSSTLVDFEKLLPVPRRKRGTVELHDAASLCAFVNEHKTDETHIYADATGFRFVAVINDATAPEPAWADHRAGLTLRQTEEWKRWAGKDNTLMSQEEFAEHIEDGAPEIVKPDAAAMLELAQTFQAKTGVDFKSSSVLQSGERQLTYNEEIKASAGGAGQITVPSIIELSLAAFEGGKKTKILARFRFRIGGGQLRIGYKLDRPEEVLREAVRSTADEIREATDIAVLNGTPPVGVGS
jgi:uncharacterized protein YfdQ (DUF2303 family)